jgi:hypothetical protein
MSAHNEHLLEEKQMSRSNTFTLFGEESIMSRKISFVIVALGGLAVLAASPARATITAPVALTSANQLDLSGSFPIAENTGGTSSTVSNTGGTVTFATWTYFSGGVNGIGGTEAGTTGNANLDIVLNTYNAGANPAGLSANLPAPAGIPYKIQLLFSDAYAPSQGTLRGIQTINVDGQTTTWDDAGTSGASVFVTATGTTGLGGLIPVTLSSPPGSYAVLNGFSLEVLPEPSTLSLLGLGGLTFLRRRARQVA